MWVAWILRLNGRQIHWQHDSPTDTQIDKEEEIKRKRERESDR